MEINAMYVIGIIAAIILVILCKNVNKTNKRNNKPTPESKQAYKPTPENKQTYKPIPENRQAYKPTPETKQNNYYEEKKEAPETLDLQGAYQSKWLFSYNEKHAYWKLKEIAEKKGYIVFAKVRLLDLIEPRHGNKKYKTFFYKVQAKHVDFVLCDQKLVARIIVELDDSSHNRQERIERDNFVDTILRNTGYKVIRVMAINDNILNEI